MNAVPDLSVLDESILHLPKIFYPSANDYIYPVNAATALPGHNCFLPLEVDTEFYHPKVELCGTSPKQPSPTITLQFRAVGLEKGEIFTHTDSDAYARHPLATSDFGVIDYLCSLDYAATLRKALPSDQNLPWIQIDLYAFFAVAELMRIVQNECRNDMHNLCLDADRKGYGIHQGRRLRTFTRYQGQYLPWVAMPWILSIFDNSYNVRLCWYDTSATHGITGYAGFCQNTGTPIPYKDVFSKAEKADMLRMYIERPIDFDNYALGDLYNHRALTNNIELFKTVYKTIDLENYFQKPRLTTGSTVRDLIESCVAKMFAMIHHDNKPRDIVNAYCMDGTADKIKKRTTTTAAYNAKVDGGRCRNNRPTDTVVRGTICDLDISGCYGEGLRAQLYPVGVPVIIDYPLDSPRNEYMTLGKFLTTYRKNLISGLWQARVSTLEDYRLKYAQDFLMSWFPPKDISKLPTDSEMSETDEWWDMDNVGTLKILVRQVNLALINEDFIQWLENIASARQRKELLDNLYVHTAMYYPANERVDSVEILRHRHDTHKGRNTCTIKQIKGKTTKISVEQECHAWYGVSLGDMFITKLLQERKRHAKKTPLNELFKLCINTTYGDMVSPYFTVGNVVVGNNITARARALAWYMEKGLHGWQTITDGCAFNLNRVLYHHKCIPNGENVVGLYRASTRDMNLLFKPLQQYDKIDLQTYGDNGLGLNLFSKSLSISSECEDSNEDTSVVVNEWNECIRVLDEKQSLEWVNLAAMEHLQALFPVVDVLHAATTDINGNPRIGQFSFEAKGLYDAASFHGTANYLFQRRGEIVAVKMRSYSSRPQESLSSDGLTVNDDDFYPAKQFLLGLLTNADALVRQPVYLKSSILKVGDYSRHYGHRYDGSTVYPE